MPMSSSHFSNAAAALSDAKAQWVQINFEKVFLFLSAFIFIRFVLLTVEQEQGPALTLTGMTFEKKKNAHL